MRRFWLMDPDDHDRSMALVETDGSLHIVDVIRFGPSIAELDDQQVVWDRVIGRVAPTMTPALNASTVDEEGIAPHPDLRRGEHGDPHALIRVLGLVIEEGVGYGHCRHDVVDIPDVGFLRDFTVLNG